MQSEQIREKDRTAFYKKNLSKHHKMYTVSRNMEEEIFKKDLPPAEVYVLAPVMMGFAMWVILSAEKNHIRKLFFMARDGYPVYRVAQRLCQVFDIKVECRYFYASRYSLRVPMYSENLEEALQHICRGGIDVTFQKIMIRSGFNADEIKWAESLFPFQNPTEKIAYPQLVKIRKMLEMTPEYLEMLKKKSTEAWPALVGYCRQEGILEDGVAIVDSGWTGTTQKSINDIRKRAGCSSGISGYYFGLFEIPKGEQPEKYHGFYFGPKEDWLNKVMFSNCFIESLFSAGHGTTRGYQMVGKEFVPVLSEPGEKDITKINDMQNLLEKYADLFNERYSGEQITLKECMSLKRLLKKSVRTLLWNPTFAEAEYFGSLYFSDDLLDDSMKELAPVLSEKEMKQNHFFNKLLTACGLRNAYIRESAWFEASAVRSGRGALKHRLSYGFYKLLSYMKKTLF